MTRLLLALLFTASCGRSQSDPTTRIAAVVSEASTFVAGFDGARVSVIVVNDGEATWEIEQAGLSYHGAGELGATPLRQIIPPLLPPRSTATIPFLVHLPGNGEGGAEIDAEVRIVDYDHGNARVLTGAETPLRFTYEAQSPDPDISDLPVLLVTTTEDELDGGESLASIADAGGAGDLSLREAITLINNQDTPYRITFDPAVFPLPVGAVIEVGVLDAPPTLRVAGSAIDGTGAGVTISSDPDTDLGWITWGIGAPRVVLRQLTVGITGYNGGGLSLGGCDDCVLEDITYTRYGGVVSIGSSERVRVRRLRITSGGLDIDDSDDVLIEDSVSAKSFEINNSTATVVRNSRGHDEWRFDIFASPNTWIVGNTFDDVDVTQVDITGDCAGTMIADNTFTDSGVWNGALPVLRVATSQRVTMSHNIMVRPNAHAFIDLVAGANADLAAPAITTATTATVAGTTGAPDGSVVEVYSDPSGGLEHWHGDAVVTGGAFNLSGLDLPSGDEVRVTVTDLDGNTSPFSAAREVP